MFPLSPKKVLHFVYYCFLWSLFIVHQTGVIIPVQNFYLYIKWSILYVVYSFLTVVLRFEACISGWLETSIHFVSFRKSHFDLFSDTNEYGGSYLSLKTRTIRYPRTYVPLFTRRLSVTSRHVPHGRVHDLRKSRSLLLKDNFCFVLSLVQEFNFVNLIKINSLIHDYIKLFIRHIIEHLFPNFY